MPQVSGYSMLNNSLFNNYNDGIIIVVKGLIKDINTKACEMLNIDKRKILNEPFELVFSDFLNEEHSLDNKIYINNYCLSIKVIPTPYGHNILLQDMSLVEDISAHISDNNMNTVAKLIDNYADGLSIVDSKGIIIHSNKTLLERLDVCSKDIIGKTSSTLVMDGIINDVTFRYVSRRKKSMDLKQIATRRDRSLFTTAVPVFNREGEIEYIVSTTRDLNSMTRLANSYKKTSVLMSKTGSGANDEFIKMLRDEGNIIESKSMIDAFLKVKKVKDTDAPVLIVGETGAGKEVFAKTLHEKGIRKNKPFIKINCGAIPSELLESELFGYEDGAFTGAKRGGKKGLFELANKGTIFLDEITALSLPLQTKLLRVLQENEIMRVGGSKTIKIDTRIIAAANDLHERLEKEEFREDLYYRLNVIQIKIPPLRKRTKDITPLINQYLKRFNTKYNKNVSFSSAALALLNLYAWPGNVRELINIVEKSVILSNKDVLDVEDLPEEINPDAANIYEEELGDLKQILYETEKNLIEKAILYYGSTRKAAKALGVSQPTIVRRLHQYSKENTV